MRTSWNRVRLCRPQYMQKVAFVARDIAHQYQAEKKGSLNVNIGVGRKWERGSRAYHGEFDPLRRSFLIADSTFFSSKGLSKLATGFSLRIICRVCSSSRPLI